VYSKGIGKPEGSPSDDDSYYTPSSVSSVESSRYDVSKLEAHSYYFGIRGPKLIFQTSKDVFTAPTWSEQRLMRFRPVYEHDKLGKDEAQQSAD
jgi:hypothetical protein